MLKRCQVLLTDWQLEYLKFIAKEYDVSFSEAVRGFMCLGIMNTLDAVIPRYKAPFTSKSILKIAKNLINGNSGEAELHKLISKLYFETRKAIEMRFALGKTLKRKNSTRRK